MIVTYAKRLLGTPRLVQKTELVECSSKKHLIPDAVKQKAVAPFEVDGWEANLHDIGNHHHFENGKWRVGFIRHVDPADTCKHYVPMNEHCDECDGTSK